MPTYPTAAWERLGREIKTARRRGGMSDSALWAQKIGRSTRTLLGLERGEPTGDDTLLRIEEALGWPTGRCIDLLESAADASTPAAAGLDPEMAPSGDLPGNNGPDWSDGEQMSPADETVLMHIPAGALAGLGPAERAEAIAKAKATILQTAREIRRQLDQ